MAKFERRDDSQIIQSVDASEREKKLCGWSGEAGGCWSSIKHGRTRRADQKEGTPDGLDGRYGRAREAGARMVQKKEKREKLGREKKVSECHTNSIAVRH